MEIRTRFYLQVQISNSIVVFLSSVPEITFWEKLVLKLQSALFKMKLDTRGYSILLILSFSRIAFLNFILTKPFLGQIWSQNFKVLCLEWNSVQRSIQGCRFWIQLFFFFNFFHKIPFGDIFGRKASKCYVWNGTWFKGVFKVVDSKFTIFFCKFPS